MFFATLTQSSNSFKTIFREQERKLKIDKKYKVNKKTKFEITKKVLNILKCLKTKIICFLVLELSIMLFFYYYIIAFCHIYKQTQVSWLLDGIVSQLISFSIIISLSFIFSILYKIGIKYKIKILYNICKLFYCI